MPKRSRTRHIVLSLLGAATLLAASPASAATPAVFSIELAPGVSGTFPTGILPNTGPNAFFVAGTASGSGVWRTDGTQAGTSRVATVDAGILIAGPVLSGNLAVFAPFSFYPAFDPAPAPDVLYVTDGTAAGTKTFAVPARPANTYSVVWRSIGAVGNRAVFSRQTTTSITDFGTTTLIRTDGTAAGTVQLSLGAATAASAEGTLHDGKLYFVTYTATSSSLRRTDGTTVEMVDAASQVGGVLHACGTTLFYSTATYTDAATTWRLRAIVGGSSVMLVESAEKAYYLTSAACIGNKLLFSRTTPDAGNEPWISDGTASGTKLLKDILPGPTGSRTGGDLAMASINGVAVFQADDVDPARPTIWVTDGTPAGTRKLGAHGTTAGRWFATGIIGRRLYLGKSGASEVLWTDGATTGVIPLGGKPWPAPNARWMTSGSRLFGFGTSPATGNEPWMLDDPDALLPAPTPPAPPLPDGGPGDEPSRVPVPGADAGAVGSSGSSGSRGGDPEADAAGGGENGGCAVRARRSPVTERFAGLASAVAMVLAVARRRRRA